MRRIRVHHPHPLDAVCMRQLAKEMGQGILLPKVLAIARGILRHQDQFLHAFFSKLMCLCDDRSKTTAAKMAAHLRNETESARTVATFGNLYEGVMRRRGEHARSEERRVGKSVDGGGVRSGNYRK